MFLNWMKNAAIALVIILAIVAVAACIVFLIFWATNAKNNVKGNKKVQISDEEKARALEKLTSGASAGSTPANSSNAMPTNIDTQQTPSFKVEPSSPIEEKVAGDMLRAVSLSDVLAIDYKNLSSKPSPNNQPPYIEVASTPRYPQFIDEDQLSYQHSLSEVPACEAQPPRQHARASAPNNVNTRETSNASEACGSLRETSSKENVSNNAANSNTTTSTAPSDAPKESTSAPSARTPHTTSNDTRDTSSAATSAFPFNFAGYIICGVVCAFVTLSVVALGNSFRNFFSRNKD